MAKQNINVGTAANDKKGDSLRAAFQKVNANFTELYTELGLVNDVTLSLGAFEFTGSTITTTDSTAIVIDQTTTITSNLSVGGDIVPQTANGGDLGSSTLPWRSLYVSNNTIFLGGVPLGLEAGTNTLKVNNVPISQSITYANIPNAPTDVADLTDIGGLLGGGADLGDLVIYNGAITTDGVSSIYLAPNGEGYGYVTVPNDTSAVSGAATVIGNSRDGGGGVQISAYNSTWQFKPNGTLLFPTLTVPIEDNANPAGTGQVLKFSDSTQQAIIFGPASTVDYPSAQRIIIQGAPGYTGTAGEGGDVYVWAGPGGSVNGNGGDIKVRAGQGNGSGNGGYLNFQAGDSGATSYGGYINIESGSSNTAGQGGTIDIVARGGGQLNLRTEQDGNIALRTNSGSNQWTFGSTGTLTFPDNTVQSTAWTGVADLARNIESEGDVNIRVNLTDSTTRIWRFGEDGLLTFPGGTNYSGSVITVPSGGIPTGVANYSGGGGWNSPPYNNLATTGGTGTGLTVNVSSADGGYINISYITINTAGTGYTDGDVITINNENNIPATFTISTLNTWTLGTTGRTTFPNGTVPAHSYGAAGDKEGMVVFTDPYIYYCKQDYVNNSTDIWVRVAWTGTNW
jgi:hypothetical protein